MGNLLANVKKQCQNWFSSLLSRTPTKDDRPLSVDEAETTPKDFDQKPEPQQRDPDVIEQQEAEVEEDITYNMTSFVLKPTIKHTASVIFLHGLGDTGKGWSSLFAAEIAKPHIKYIFPTAPIRSITAFRGERMNAWFDKITREFDAVEDERGVKKSSQYLLDLVKKEMAEGIPAEKVFIGGFSQGGAIAIYTALTAPLRFAGVIVMSSRLPLYKNFPAQLNPAQSLSLPILQCHGDADDVIALSFGTRTADVIRACGFNSFQFKIYSGLKHSSCPDEMDDVADFIQRIAPN